MWSVCWDSGEGQLGLTRGGPVSPNCHREHGQRGSVSTIINHTPSLSLSLSLSLPLFLSLTLFHTVSFCNCLSLCLFLCHSLFYSLLLFFSHFFLSEISSFPLRHSVAYCTTAPPTPSLAYTHFNLPSVTFSRFLSLSNLFHPCLSSVLAHTFSQKMFFTCPLDWQSRCSGRTRYLAPTPKGIHSPWFIIPRESDLSAEEMEKWTKEKIKKTKIRISKKYIEDTQRKHSQRLSLKITFFFLCE